MLLFHQHFSGLISYSKWEKNRWQFPFTALWYVLLANVFRLPLQNLWQESVSRVLSLKMIHLHGQSVPWKNSLSCEQIPRAKRTTYWALIEKAHIQKSQRRFIQSEILEQKDGRFSNTQSFSVSHTCCPVTCIDNSSWIKCQHYHLQLCCWHAFAISLKIPLIFWLFNSWATPHLNIQKSILFQPN